MAKSANDNMMTRPHLRGVLAPLTLPAYCHGLGGRKSPLECRCKVPVGGMDWGRSPQKLKCSYYRNFKQNFSLFSALWLSVVFARHAWREI